MVPRKIFQISNILLTSQFLVFCPIIRADRRSSYDKYESYATSSNETRTLPSAGVASSNLDSIFTPKVFKGFPPQPSLGGQEQRSGIGIDKGPPDLQFGLSFTVPFVSLSTDKLLNQVSNHRGYDSLWDLANVLKLNLGGLAVAAVVGIAALFLAPTLLPWKFGSGWGQNFGGFFPGFLDHLLPAVNHGVITKPLGYGQTYDYNSIPYNKDPYAYNSYTRAETLGKSRALKEDENNQTSGNFWTSVFRDVRNTAQEFESCALYTVCERGRNFTLEVNKNSTGFSQSKRTGRSSKNDGEDEFKVSNVEHILGAVRELGGDGVPGLTPLQNAFEQGKIGKDCSNFQRACPLANIQIGQVVQNLGQYIFS